MCHTKWSKALPVLPVKSGGIFVCSLVFREASTFPIPFWIKGSLHVTLLLYNTNASNFSSAAMFTHQLIGNQLNYEFLLDR